jgi:hypothetical protein
MPKAYAQVSVRLEFEEMEALDRAVEAQGPGVTRNAVIRRVLVEWAETHQPKGAERPQDRERGKE